MKVFSIIGALLFGMIAVLTLLVTLGFPLGEFTLGGMHKVLPTNMRIASGISFVIQIVAICMILYVGGVISLNFSLKIAKGICMFFAVYLLINTGMNFFSDSLKERYVMTPLALISSICFFITVLKAN